MWSTLTFWIIGRTKQADRGHHVWPWQILMGNYDHVWHFTGVRINWLIDRFINDKHDMLFSALGVHLVNCLEPRGGGLTEEYDGCCFFELRCSTSVLCQNRWLPDFEMAAAAIFSALFHALMSWTRLPDCSAIQMTGCWFALARLMQEHRSRSDHQIFQIVYVVIIAKPKWIIDQRSWSHVLHNCQTIGSVNCIPIGHMLGQ